LGIGFPDAKAFRDPSISAAGHEKIQKFKRDGPH
jgi:hypothetical protein